jgi:hypothetical protein
MAIMASTLMSTKYTRVRLNSAKSKSVETTIPDWIAALMDVHKKDDLEWEYDQARRRATLFKVVRKSKS